MKRVIQCNQRRYYRYDVMLPVFVDILNRREEIAWETGDFGIYALPFFYRDKKGWLEEKIQGFRRSVDKAVARSPECEQPFDQLAEKLVILEDFLQHISDGINPLKSANAFHFKSMIERARSLIDLSVVSNAPKTQDILSQFDEKVSYFAEILETVCRHSTAEMLYVHHMPSGFKIDHTIAKLRVTAEKAPLARAFVDLYDYMAALTDIYEQIMTRNDPQMIAHHTRKVNLSCGGISLSSPFHIGVGDHVRVTIHLDDYLSHLKERAEERPVMVQGWCIRSVFDANSGEWRIAVNFDFLSDLDFTRINSYLQNQEIHDALSWLESRRNRGNGQKQSSMAS